MNLIGSIVDWKQYVRNRLLGLLHRAGSEALFKPLGSIASAESIAELIRRLDSEQQCLMRSIEKYALGTPESMMRFANCDTFSIPADGDAEAFSEALHKNFERMIDFISGLDVSDLEKIIERNGISARVSAGWLIQFTTFREQEMLSRIQAALESNGSPPKAPWASQSYLRPVRKLEFK